MDPLPLDAELAAFYRRCGFGEVVGKRPCTVKVYTGKRAKPRLDHEIWRDRSETYRGAMEDNKVNAGGNAEVMKSFVSVAKIAFSRDAEVNAAAGVITATERKAEGLSD